MGDLAVFVLKSGFVRVKGKLVNKLSLTKTYRSAFSGLVINAGVPASATSHVCIATDAKGQAKVTLWYIMAVSGQGTVAPLRDEILKQAALLFPCMGPVSLHGPSFFCRAPWPSTPCMLHADLLICCRAGRLRWWLGRCAPTSFCNVLSAPPHATQCADKPQPHHRILSNGAGTKTRFYDSICSVGGNAYSALEDATGLPAGDPGVGLIQLSTPLSLKANKPVRRADRLAFGCDLSFTITHPAWQVTAGGHYTQPALCFVSCGTSADVIGKAPVQAYHLMRSFWVCRAQSSLRTSCHSSRSPTLARHRCSRR